MLVHCQGYEDCDDALHSFAIPLVIHILCTLYTIGENVIVIPNTLYSVVSIMRYCAPVVGFVSVNIPDGVNNLTQRHEGRQPPIATSHLAAGFSALSLRGWPIIARYSQGVVGYYWKCTTINATPQRRVATNRRVVIWNQPTCPVQLRTLNISRSILFMEYVLWCRSSILIFTGLAEVHRSTWSYDLDQEDALHVMPSCIVDDVLIYVLSSIGLTIGVRVLRLYRRHISCGWSCFCWSYHTLNRIELYNTCYYYILLFQYLRRHPTKAPWNMTNRRLLLCRLRTGYSSSVSDFFTLHHIVGVH